MSVETASLPLPDLSIDGQGVVRSGTYNDVYFSKEGGAAETDYVFLQGNSLPERWQNKADFTIGELGFGTGLNFLVAMERFLKTNRDGRLHYLAVEKFPLSKKQLQQLHGEHALVKNYPDRLPGMHRVRFGRVFLTLAFGDVATLLPELNASVDAWFLDGFAPAKNPEMWSDEVLKEVARLSASGATFATFTAAGAVKRGLEANGFSVEKIDGFGSKRDMLRGHYRCASLNTLTPTLSLSEGEGGTRVSGRVRVATVVGAGIAGCTVARALAERGIKVTVVEKNKVASGASGNAAAVLYPQLTKTYGNGAQWHFAGYGLARRMLQQAPVGMLKIGKDAEDETQLRANLERLQMDDDVARWIDAKEASEKLGTEIKHGGVWFEQGTWLDPRAWCQQLLDHKNITLREGVEGKAEGLTILCTAQVEGLPTGVSAGQVSEVSGLKLGAILCHKGYAIPSGHIGATYDHDDLSGSVTEANSEENLETLQAYLPGAYKIVSGRTSFRASTPDRLPYVGQLAENIWVSAGHGSRGMISAPLAAELIASEICGEPLPVTERLRKAVSPLRAQKAMRAAETKPSRLKTGS